MEIASALRRAYSGEEDDGMWGVARRGAGVSGYCIHDEAPGLRGRGAGVEVAFLSFNRAS